MGENCYYRWVKIAPRHHALAMLRTSWTLLMLPCSVLTGALEEEGVTTPHPHFHLEKKAQRSGGDSCFVCRASW